MPHVLVSEPVDIYKLPSKFDTADINIQCTVGDLHGNFMKLLFFLVRTGVVTDLSTQNYEKLAAIYKISHNQLTEQHITDFNAILDGITINKAFIRLIGDELADRGQNDYLTIRLLQKLISKEAKVEILLSNHGVEFMRACSQNNVKMGLIPPTYGEEFACSLLNVNKFIRGKIIGAQEFLDFYHNYYVPNIKVISYSLFDKSQGITIYSHAPIGLNTIRSVAGLLSVSYEDKTSIDLARTIDCVNQKFRQLVMDGKLSEILFCIYTGDCVYAAAKDNNSNSPSSGVVSATYGEYISKPLSFVINNRELNIIERPSEHNGYKITFVHGHDDKIDVCSSQRGASNNVVNLENNNGLGRSIDRNLGYFNMLRSKGVVSPSPAQDFDADVKNGGDILGGVGCFFRPDFPGKSARNQDAGGAPQLLAKVNR